MNEKWKWPGGAQAAVSLTYDDGVNSALDNAIPDLERAGLRGSFYLPIRSSPQVIPRRDDWKRAFLDGHEVGNHTVRHPCRGQQHAHRLETYTPEEIRKEVLTAADWLNKNIGADEYRTFAYPCGHVAIGDPPDEKPFLSAVASRHFAARLAGGGVNDPSDVAENPLKIKAAVIGYPNGRDVGPFVEHYEEAARLGWWAVYVFHGIGDQWLPTKRSVHQQLIKHLRERRFWIAPLRDVAKYILRPA